MDAGLGDERKRRGSRESPRLGVRAHSIWIRISRLCVIRSQGLGPGPTRFNSPLPNRNTRRALRMRAAEFGPCRRISPFCCVGNLAGSMKRVALRRAVAIALEPLNSPIHANPRALSHPALSAVTYEAEALLQGLLFQESVAPTGSSTNICLCRGFQIRARQPGWPRLNDGEARETDPFL